MAVLVLAGGSVNLQAQTAADLDIFAIPRAGLACPGPDEYQPQRPDPIGTPTTVGLALFLADIVSLNDVDQTMEADVYVVMRWHDPRLADASRGEGGAECPLPAGGFWMPELEPENLRSRIEFYPPRFVVDAMGRVMVGRRLLVKVANPLDFRDFPFDKHDWKFTLWPILSRSDEMLFHPLARLNGRSEQVSIQGWTVGQPLAQVDVATRPVRTGTYARFDLVVPLTRNWTYYVWKLGLPLTLIVLMAYGVYFIPAANVTQQIGLGMTSMLTLIAYMLALGGGLPKISYLTRADQFFVGSAILVFLGLVKALVTVSLTPGVDRPWHDRLNQVGRWVYPGGMILNLLNAFYR